MAASPREQVEGALRHLGFKPSQVKAGLAALPPGDARPMAEQLKHAIGHVDDAPAEATPKAESATRPAPKAQPPAAVKPVVDHFRDKNRKESEARAAAKPTTPASPPRLALARRPVPTSPPRREHQATNARDYMRRAKERQATTPRSARELHKLSGLPSIGRLVAIGVSLGLPIAALLIFGRDSAAGDTTPPAKPVPAPGAPPAAQVGRAVKVTLPRGQKNTNATLRAAASPSGAVVAGVRPGTEATVLEGPTKVKGEPWFRVSTTSATGEPATGWMHGSLLPGASTT